MRDGIGLKLFCSKNHFGGMRIGGRIVGKDKDVTEYINIGMPVKSDLHYRFTADEIALIRSAAETDDYAALVFVLIYSGVRPGDMFGLSSAACIPTIGIHI